MWAVMVIAFGAFYWVGAMFGAEWLYLQGTVVMGDIDDLSVRIYFSFVTALSIGYGDVSPLGFARILAIIEGAAGLLLFGWRGIQAGIAPAGGADRGNSSYCVRAAARPGSHQPASGFVRALESHHHVQRRGRARQPYTNAGQEHGGGMSGRAGCGARSSVPPDHAPDENTLASILANLPPASRRSKNSCAALQPPRAISSCSTRISRRFMAKPSRSVPNACRNPMRRSCGSGWTAFRSWLSESSDCLGGAPVSRLPGKARSIYY